MRLAEAIAANRAAVDTATKPQLRKLLPLLKQAERELTAELGQWLTKQSPTDRYDKHRHRALLAQLKGTIRTIERKVGKALEDDVVEQGGRARATSLRKLNAMVETGALEFEGAIRPLRVDVASVLASEKDTMLAQMRGRGTAYSRDVVTDINNRLGLGVLRGETVDQLTSRLLASSGLIRAFKRRGPAAVAGGVAERTFGKYRWWAEQIARTELVNAYASTQARTLRAADAEDPGWSMKWDAANDARVCPFCKSLDNETIRPDGLFRVVGRFGARPHPPLHPCCRCALVPWRAEWNTKRGRSK